MTLFSAELPCCYLSDSGFRQTLKVRTLGCARRSLPLPTRVSSPRKGSNLHEEQHKGHEVYTSSGHRCGVIPYSSLWCGGLPQGPVMNNTMEELPREGRSSCGGAASWEGLNPDPFLLWWLALFIERGPSPLPKY